MRRKKVRRRKDRKVFNQTARKTRKINLSGAGMRGGIRL